MSSGRVRALFETHYGRAPDVVASAPGRVNLIGEHTDYNGGEVLPMAIDLRTWIALSPSVRDESRAVSSESLGEATFDATSPLRSGRWVDYVAGAVREARVSVRFAEQLDVAVVSDVPLGAGLSSSAALEVATVVAVSALGNGRERDRWGSPARVRTPASVSAEAARTAHRAETEFVGVACGIMDQYASALAREKHAVHIWCDSADYEHVPFGDAVLVFDTATPRNLRESAFNTRREECERALEQIRAAGVRVSTLAAATPEMVEAYVKDPLLRRRARHVVRETRRVAMAVSALRSTGHIPGGLLAASHASLRDDYECSSPELDWFVTRCEQEPAIAGARLTGAGWGGCAIALGERESLRGLGPAIGVDYEARFGRAPRWWVTMAARGAAVESA